MSALSALILASLLAAGQSPTHQPANPEKGHVSTTSPGKTAADYPREPYLFEFVHETMRFENDGTGARSVQARMHINTAAGLARAGQLVFEYSAANEQLEIQRVRVIKPDGSVIVAGPDAVQDLTAPVAREAPMYTDARQKHVTVPGVAVGDSVEYEVTTTTKPLMPGQFWHTWNFCLVICLDEQVDLNVPRNRPLKLKGPSGLTPTIRNEGDRRIYHWSTSMLQYPESGTPFGNFTFDPQRLLMGMQAPKAPQLVFSTLQSWEEVGRWYAQLEHDRRMVTPEVRAQAGKIVSGQTTEQGKAQALYEWVSRNVRYVSLSFGVGRYQPHAAADVLTHRYGDCKDKSTLLEAFLEAEGIPSQAVLINSRSDVDPEVPSPLQFDHAITLARIAGHKTWLDSTVGVGPFSYLLPQLRGKQALVVFTDALPALEKTPEELAIPTLYRLLVKAEISQDGTMDGVIGIDTRGDMEVLLRLGILTMPPGQFSAIMERAASAQQDKDFSIADLKTDDATDIGRPFHLEMHVHDKTGKDDLPNGPGQFGSDFLKGLLSEKNLRSLLPEGGEASKNALRLGGPKEYSLEVKLVLPAAVSGKGNPVAVHIAKSFAEYNFHSELTDRSFDGVWDLKINALEAKPGEIKDYAAFRKEVVGSLMGSTVKAEGKPAASGAASGGSSLPGSRAVHIRPPEAELLFQQAMQQMKLQNWGNAEQKLESVVKADDQDDTSWNNLGQARMYLRKYDSAEAAFRKLLDLKPDSQLATAQMAWVLTTERRYSEAAEVLEKRIAKYPDDGDAHRRLGLAYVSLHRPNQAVIELEKATVMLPKNASAFFYLGQAYLQAHNGTKAGNAFGRSLELESNDMAFNNAAYQLAAANTNLELAEKWSLKSINDVEVELNQATLGSLPPRIVNLIGRVGIYWDTLGWIRFQKNDFSAAEKYVAAAWQLGDRSTEGEHLGRIYEAQNRRREAIETYAQVLALVPPGREASEDEKEARSRLAKLLGSDGAVEPRITQSRSRVKNRRRVEVPNPDKLEGLGQYLMMIGPEAKLLELRPVGQENELGSVAARLQDAKMPFVFPDTTLAKMPLSGVLTCPSAGQPCHFILSSAQAAAVAFAANPAEQ